MTDHSQQIKDNFALLRVVTIRQAKEQVKASLRKQGCKLSDFTTKEIGQTAAEIIAENFVASVTRAMQSPEFNRRIIGKPHG